MEKKRKITMMDLFKNPRYRGKHIILVAGKVFTAKTGEGASEILAKVRVKYPKAIPEIAYLPKANSLIYRKGSSFSFFDTNEVPAIMGRLGFLETFDAIFLKTHAVIFKN